MSACAGVLLPNYLGIALVLMIISNSLGWSEGGRPRGKVYKNCTQRKVRVWVNYILKVRSDNLFHSENQSGIHLAVPHDLRCMWRPTKSEKSLSEGDAIPRVALRTHQHTESCSENATAFWELFWERQCESVFLDIGVTPRVLKALGYPPGINDQGFLNGGFCQEGGIRISGVARTGCNNKFCVFLAGAPCWILSKLRDFQIPVHLRLYVLLFCPGVGVDYTYTSLYAHQSMYNWPYLYFHVLFRPKRTQIGHTCTYTFYTQEIELW